MVNLSPCASACASACACVSVRTCVRVFAVHPRLRVVSAFFSPRLLSVALLTPAVRGGK